MASILDVLEAKEEIRDLITRYCNYLDFGRYDEWVSCFTEDGVFDSPFFGRYPGKTALRKQVEDYYTSIGTVQYRHNVTNVQIDVDVDAGRATSKSYWLYTQVKGEKIRLIRFGQYIAQIVKVNGKWLFKEVKAPLD